MDNPNYDYSDSYAFIIRDPGDKVGLFDVGELFAAPGPKWVERLLALRDSIVGVFGLKTSASAPKQGPKDRADRWQPGAQAGMFRVFGKTDNELTLGEDDKHLDFRVVVILERCADDVSKKKLTVTTHVKRHNFLGKCYFFFIKPFHKIIVPATMRQKIKRLETRING